MKEIKLTKGQVALVDDDIYDELNSHNWFAVKHGNNYYACRRLWNGGHPICISMHRVVMGIADKSIHIDHKDCNSTNNQRFNLRICTRFENQANAKAGVNQSSKYKGVTWYKRGNKWHCKIQYHNQRIHLGYFNNEDDAGRAYDKKALELFGEFARLNFQL